MVRGTKGPLTESLIELGVNRSPLKAEDGGTLQGLFFGQSRQQRRQALGQHGFACAWRSHQQQAVATRGSDFQGPLGRALATDVLQVEAVVAWGERT